MTEVKFVEMKVDYIDHMGSDINVVNAARVSFAKEAKEFDLDKDSKLINYLAKHNHWSPLAHTSVSIRVKAPIFMARQFVKHQIGLVWNEESRRYIDDEVEYFKPKYWRMAADSVKQGSSVEPVSVPILSGKCVRCDNMIVYPEDQGRKNTAKSRYKYCSNKCQAAHWRERNPELNRYTRWKANAKSKGVVFDLDIDDLDWPKTCAYLDIELDYNNNELSDNSPSLDRIVPELGYITGNVQIISNKANRMKNDASLAELMQFAKRSLMIHEGVFVETANTYDKYIENIDGTYRRMIDGGVAPELARTILPQSAMTSWIWTGSLVAFARVCKLRLDSHAQKEAQELAQKINAVVAPLYPVSWAALMEHMKV